MNVASRIQSNRTAEAQLAILNAPFEENGWYRAICAVMDCTGSSSAHLLGAGGPLLAPFSLAVGHVTARMDIIDDQAMFCEGNWRVNVITRPMAIQHETDYRAYRVGRQTALYDDASSTLDVPYGCQSALIIDRQHFLGLALLRSSRDGPCDARTLEEFSILRHHLARSVHVQLALDGEVSEQLLHGIPPGSGPTFLLDRHGVLCAATPDAYEMIGAGALFRPGEIGLSLNDPGDDAAFQRALFRLYSAEYHGDASLVEELRIGRTPERPRGSWRLVVARLPEDRTGLGFRPFVAMTVRRA